jgi:2-dehydropantoate 2-reductase
LSYGLAEESMPRVAILGAGALGASYAAQFHQAPGYHTLLVAGGDRHDRLVREGLVVNGLHHSIPVHDPSEVAPPADLIIVALKHHQLEGALHDLRGLVGEDTIIISVMNGLDSERMLGGAYGMDRILYTISVGIDAVRQGSQVSYTTPGKLIFGEKDNAQISERVRRVQTMLDAAGIRHETPVDMVRMLWWKLMVNVGVNQASAVMRASYGVFQSSTDAQALMETLMRETIAVAEAEGVDLTEDDLQEWYPLLHSLSPNGKTSMLQDVEGGRKTEVEIFSGKVVELGKQHGVPTPVNEAVLQIIHVLEGAADNGSQASLRD